MKEDKLECDRFNRWKNKILEYKSMGLIPLNLYDRRSPLECQYCGKISGRSSAHIFRHEEDCPHLPVVMKLLGNPRTTWSRQTRQAA